MRNAQIGFADALQRVPSDDGGQLSRISWQHGIRLLGQSGGDGEQQPAVKKGRRIYDEAVRQALIVVSEAADRISGKRLKAALPHLVESMERHGHLDLDPRVRQRLLAASAATGFPGD